MQKGFTPILIVLILAALVGGYLIYQNQPKPIPSPSLITQPSPTPDKTANWKTYTSKRANFLFQYPSSWPIAAATDGQLKESNILQEKDYGDIESINFEKEWSRSAGGPSLGYIIVQKIKGMNTLDDYTETIDKETVLEGTAKGRVVIPAPEITNTSIGGEPAISINDKVKPQFSAHDYEYIVVKDGLVYKIALILNPAYIAEESRASYIEEFNKILSTFKFLP